MFDAENIKPLFGTIIAANVETDVWNWLQEKTEAVTGTTAWNIAFASIPRKTGKKIISSTEEQTLQLQQTLPGFSIHNWTIDRLCRVWFLMNVKFHHKEQYFKSLETVFLSAEVNELVALYSSLPFLSFPEMWAKRCAEGIRSNIGSVLEAIMYHNPYPAKFLDEAAWNQLVLKAIFTDKQLELITGLHQRTNKELAIVLVDYAKERLAAGRTVHPQLWKLTAGFIDEKIVGDLKKIVETGDASTKKAIADAGILSGYESAENRIAENN